MAVRARTASETNGTDGHAKIAWGLDVIIPATMLFAGVAGLYATTISDIAVLKKGQEEIRSSRKDAVLAIVREADKAEDYVTRKEWSEDRDAQNRALKEAIDPMREDLRAILMGQRENHAILKSLNR